MRLAWKKLLFRFQSTTMCSPSKLPRVFILTYSSHYWLHLWISPSGMFFKPSLLRHFGHMMFRSVVFCTTRSYTRLVPIMVENAVLDNVWVNTKDPFSSSFDNVSVGLRSNVCLRHSLQCPWYQRSTKACISINLEKRALFVLEPFQSY